jgi:hypothetical protein
VFWSAPRTPQTFTSYSCDIHYKIILKSSARFPKRRTGLFPRSTFTKIVSLVSLLYITYTPPFLSFYSKITWRAHSFKFFIIVSPQFSHCSTYLEPHISQITLKTQPEICALPSDWQTKFDTPHKYRIVVWDVECIWKSRRTRLSNDGIIKMYLRDIRLDVLDWTQVSQKWGSKGIFVESLSFFGGGVKSWRFSIAWMICTTVST